MWVQVQVRNSSFNASEVGFKLMAGVLRVQETSKCVDRQTRKSLIGILESKAPISIKMGAWKATQSRLGHPNGFPSNVQLSAVIKIPYQHAIAACALHGANKT
jgi:hypothetical protein